jgi:tRNA dimethylallyltransferase
MKEGLRTIFLPNTSPFGGRGARFLIVIVGPTAIGKTSLSIALAKHFNCEIVSADSRQFYAEMSIGTAVPSQEEQLSVKHHFIQTKSIQEYYTVGNFEKEAILTLNQLFQNNNYAILVGGSGLYIDAVLNGLDNFPTVNPDNRGVIEEDFETNGITYLQDKLKELDPAYFSFLTRNNPQTLQNPQRMKRFLEVCIGTGKPYSSFLNKNKTDRNFTPILIGLEADREIIYDRINQRVDTMMQQGLLQEAQNLVEFKNNNALQTVGYRELFSFFSGEITLEFAIEEIKKNTRRFAKRQLTWFKKSENVAWFDYLASPEKIIQQITSQSV